MSECKYIEGSWQSYCEMVVPKDAGDTQIAETRQAFYAGASILFSVIMIALDDDAEPTANDMKKMESIQAEIDAFGQELDKRIFELTEH